MTNLDVYIVGLILITALMLFAFDRGWLDECTDRLDHMVPAKRAGLLVIVSIATGVVWPVMITLCILDIGNLITKNIFK